MPHDEYATADIWQAATLDCFGIQLLRVSRRWDGKQQWVFANQDGKAWQTAQEYRTDGWMLVPVLKFKDAHRYLARQANLARQAERTVGEQSNGKREPH